MNAPNIPPSSPPDALKKHGCFFYGCLTVIIVAALIAIGGGIAAYYGMNALGKLAAEYSENAPAQLAKVTLPSSEYGALQRRLDAFKSALGEGRSATLTLTGDELNALIAGGQSASPWKDQVRFAIAGSNLTCQLSLPLSGMAKLPGFGSLKDRYLNGSAVVRASMDTGVLFVTLQSVEVKGKPLPEQFLVALRSENLAKEAYKNPETAKLLNQLKDLKIHDGVLTLVGKSAQ